MDEGEKAPEPLTTPQALGYIGLWAGGAVLLPLWFLLPYHVRWPADCVPNLSRRHGGLIREYYCSPGLLEGGPREILLFIILWSVPAALAALGIARLIYGLSNRDAGN